MRNPRFNIGGYRFDDWGQVKELYVPEDISSSTDKSLHMRGREALPHHLQHYVVPNDKVFVAFAVSNVLLSTTASIGSEPGKALVDTLKAMRQRANPSLGRQRIST